MIPAGLIQTVTARPVLVATPTDLAARTANDDDRPRSRTTQPPSSMGLPAGTTVADFRGVAATASICGGTPVYDLCLLGHDPLRSVVLASDRDAGTIASLWRAWGEHLELPLIAVDADGTECARLCLAGGVVIETPVARRKGSPLVGRRSRYARRRRAAAPFALPAIAAAHTVSRARQ